MCCSTGVCGPDVDPELVRFATRIPPSMKQQGMVGKAIFKKAMEPLMAQRKAIMQNYAAQIKAHDGVMSPLQKQARDLRDQIKQLESPKH